MENAEHFDIPVLKNNILNSSTTIAEEPEDNDPLITATKLPEQKEYLDTPRKSSLINIPSARRRSSIINIPSRRNSSFVNIQSTRRKSSIINIPSARRKSSLYNIPSQESLRDNSFRGKCYRFLHTWKFQVIVIFFVVLDCIFVISELIVDLRITKDEVCDKVTCEPVKKDHSLSVIIQSISLAILSMFMIELMFKLYALQLDFFRSKMEMFDGVIVAVSWSLDIAFFKHDDETVTITLLIFIRMWRLVRIVHAIAVSMITPVAHQLENEEHAHHATQTKLDKLTKHSKKLEHEINELRNMLRNSNRVFPETKIGTTTGSDAS